LNDLDSDQHDFIFGDVFDWLSRLARKHRSYDLILLDPPTFSQSKQSGPFRAERDYGKLVQLALPLLKPAGVLFASTNASGWAPAGFISTLRGEIGAASRRVTQEHYVAQPPDFPISRAEPAYLKTAWFRIL
jgi:23S rRNA (cytosine1962-C5)-methyltransferase